VRIQANVALERKQRINAEAGAVVPFENLTLKDGLPLSVIRNASQPYTVPVWLGESLQLDLGYEYIVQRSQLSNAAYNGRWDQLFQIIDRARADYFEPWINCIRLSKLYLKDPSPDVDMVDANYVKESQTDANYISGWTPLHQAVYLCAPKKVVEKMLELGAWSERIRTPDLCYC
jgi:hypothetical protein